MYYFTYASNLDKKQMKLRCPESKPLYTATLPNYKLVFIGWSRQWKGGLATIRLSRGDKVMGAVYEITERDLRRLDGYEGYPSTYNRFEATVYNEDNEAIKAVTYIKSDQLDENPPSKEYAMTIRQGYKDWGII